MAKAILIRKTGGPDVLKWEEVRVDAPSSGQIRIRQKAVGLNFIDVYHRSGVYPAPAAFPFTPGLEAAGVVEELGPGVDDFAVGDRIAYGVGAIGAYAEERLVPVDRIVRLPDSIDERTAAAMMLKGMTVQYLLRNTYRVKSGDTILIHAAAGGVGLIACQWAKHLGATVIGTVGTEAKARLAKENGCDHPIVYTNEDFVERVRDLTGGRGVPVVYDSVGNDTFMKSLECLSPLGMMVSFGQSSGVVPPFEIRTLSQKGSLFLTRPSLMTYAAKREDLESMAVELFEVITKKAVKITIGQTFPLSDAAEAHRALQARGTTGSTLLIP